MSDLSEYIKNALDEDYSFEGDLSESAISSLKLYKHNNSGKKVLLLKTLNRNDEVFRELSRYDCKGFLPQIYLVSSEDDALYVVEEYVEGTPLSKTDFEEDESRSVKCAIDICRALSILHSLGIVHRDVKPENVIIKPDESAALIDLSIAKKTGSKSQDTQNLGTIGYAAPEQFGFMQSRPETDIYALGVMLNILVTDAHPMQMYPGGRLGKIIKKCTSLNIGERYSDIDSLMNDLMKLI